LVFFNVASLLFDHSPAEMARLLIRCEKDYTQNTIKCFDV